MEVTSIAIPPTFFFSFFFIKFSFGIKIEMDLDLDLPFFGLFLKAGCLFKVLTGLGARAGFSRKDLRKVAPIDNESSDLQSLKIEIQNRVSNKNIEI